MTDSLSQVAIQLTQAIVPVIIVVGVVGNGINIAVLTRPQLCNHSCSQYFLALATNNLFYSGGVLVYRLLSDGYKIDPTRSSLVICKLFTYMNQLSALLSPYFIVLASIDRYCASSKVARLRKFSSLNVARKAILVNFIILALIHSNTAILIDLRSTDTFGCRIRSDSLYKQFYTIFQVFLFGILAPFLMALFGMLTISNTQRARMVPTANTRYRRTENQLARMLFLQVTTHIVLCLPTCVTYLILVFPNTLSSTSGFYFARMLSQIPLHTSYTTAFVLYVVSARLYRRELIRLVRVFLRLPDHSQIQPTTNNITNTMIGIDSHGLRKTTTHF